VDTLDVRPLPGIILKHFTAHDVISRWDVVSVHSRANASTAAHFLDTLESRMPFPVRAIQVDGGAEFEVIFEEECQRRDIKLFVLPPRSPKLMVSFSHTVQACIKQCSPANFQFQSSSPK